MSRQFLVEYIEKHEWFGPVSCPRYEGEQHQLRSCMCGATRWFDDDGIEHMEPGFVPHPIRQSLDDPGWLTIVAVTTGNACPLSEKNAYLDEQVGEPTDKGEPE